MTDVFEVAGWVSRELDEAGFRHCFIGGIALQAFGEPRVTRDVDVSVLVGFGDEARQIAALLRLFGPRTEGASDFALVHRVLLCQSPEGIGIDIGLAAFPYEEDAMGRSVLHEFLPGQIIRVAGPEDLVTMKVFAGRPQDWIDVRGVLVRQRDRLDWDLIDGTLPELLEAVDEPERLDRLHELRDSTK